MAKLAAPQLLKKGLAFCGANFPRIVETWNWLVNVAQNAKGDADVNPKTGKITIDRTDAHNPVIRCKGCSGSGGSDAEVLPSAFQIKKTGEHQMEDDEGTYYMPIYTFSNCYYNVGGVMNVAANQEYPLLSYPAFLCARFKANADGTFVFDSIVEYHFISDDLRSAQKDMSSYVIPLYLVNIDDDGNELPMVDLRTAPQLQAYEGLIS